jgi:hypothetical protein
MTALAFAGVLALVDADRWPGAPGRASLVRTVWDSFHAAAPPVRVLIAVIFLPWVIGLAIWFARWPWWLRVILVGGLAWATLFAFAPGQSR